MISRSSEGFAAVVKETIRRKWDREACAPCENRRLTEGAPCCAPADGRTPETSGW
jgi:hypothetical protein